MLDVADHFLLRAQNLVKTRLDGERKVTVVLPSLFLEPGDRIALVGPSGSGKSTVLAMLSLATYPDASTDGHQSFAVEQSDVVAAWAVQDMETLSQLRARSLSFLPQRDGLLEFLTVDQNIRCAAELAGITEIEGLEEIIDSLHLGGLLASHPARLSGGQRQRAAVACTLARRPSVILADEPTASLDAENAKRVMSGICKLADLLGAAVVLATHQLDLVDEYGFRPWIARETVSGSERRSVFEAMV